MSKHGGMSAILSACGKYRYRLDREVHGLDQDGPVFAYFGVNPSTADAAVDDATVRRCRGFTRVYGGRRFIVGNVFGYRSTDVRTLAKAADPFGPDNSLHIARIIDDADVLVPCWGATGKVPDRLRGDFASLLGKLQRSRKPVMHFGKTASGDPKHPLMLGYETPLTPWGGP